MSPRFFSSRRITLAIVAVALIALIGWWSQRGLRFDPQRWQRMETDERARMLEDLFRRHPLEGMSRRDVESLLGEGVRHPVSSSSVLYALAEHEESRGPFRKPLRYLEVRYDGDLAEGSPLVRGERCVRTVLHPTHRFGLTWHVHRLLRNR